MAIPSIDARTSTLSIREGGAFTFSPAATGSPTSWAASGLPSGLSINTSTGEITGTVTATSGIYHVTLSATNIDGTDEIILVIPVFVASTSIEDDITIEINFDLITGKVIVVGMGEADFSPPTVTKREEGLRRAAMLIKEGDRFPVSVGFTRDGILQDLDIETLRLKCKEFEPDASVGLFEGSFTKVGAGRLTRYTTVMNVKENLLAGILSNYEEDFGTYFDALAEIEFSILVSSSDYDVTKIAALTLTASDSDTSTLVFNDLAKLEQSVTYDFDVALSVTGRAAQNAALSVSASVEYNSDSGLFEVGTILGAITAQGADEGAAFHWRTTLSLVSIVGTALGVNVTVKTDTTSVGEGDIIFIPQNGDWSIAGGLATFAPYGLIEASFEAQEVLGASPNAFYMAAGETSAGLLATVNALPSFADSLDAVYFEDGVGIYFVLAVGTNLFQIEEFPSGIYASEPSTSAISKSGSHSVNLTGTGLVSSYRKTSETFILRVERDITADV